MRVRTITHNYCSMNNSKLEMYKLSYHYTAGSEDDLASSSEGDDASRLAVTSGQTSGQCSPFNRRQFPRDSGCYDAHKNPIRRTASPGNAKLSRENNLDTTAQGKMSIAEGTSLPETKDDFHPNIPITVNDSRKVDSHFEKSPLLRGGNVRLLYFSNIFLRYFVSN